MKGIEVKDGVLIAGGEPKKDGVTLDDVLWDHLLWLDKEAVKFRKTEPERALQFTKMMCKVAAILAR